MGIHVSASFVLDAVSVGGSVAKVFAAIADDETKSQKSTKNDGFIGGSLSVTVTDTSQNQGRNKLRGDCLPCVGCFVDNNYQQGVAIAGIDLHFDRVGFNSIDLPSHKLWRGRRLNRPWSSWLLL